jgi:uncharacterized protein with PIN domain
MTSCAHCGAPIPRPTGRQARRRYCDERCRKAAWRRRHHHDTVAHVVADIVPVPDNVPNIVPDVVTVPTASRDAVPTPGGQHRCPHCRQPLAVISVIVPAAAAHVPTPEVIHISPT